ncbi:hypothetical protein [Planotetraspora mira]|uniref:Uncharacterized protein n=1 Tax=Planotetraspora mira TaxID=58121 RepID=A0A8J3TIC0_9ACTN|nr:hypothetical protein [Planotetraspora mira]GII26953.1 hypothetical protein Pmi06nite_03950 [Planotetraspora mira]
MTGIALYGYLVRVRRMAEQAARMELERERRAAEVAEAVAAERNRIARELLPGGVLLTDAAPRW